MAQEAWRAYLELALGITDATRKRATKAVTRMVGKSGVTAEQLQALAEDLVKMSATNREALTKLVRYELDRALGKVGLATAEEVAELTDRVRELEGQLRAAESDSGSSGETAAAMSAVAKKAVAKKAVAKKTTSSAGTAVGGRIGAAMPEVAATGGAEPLPGVGTSEPTDSSADDKAGDTDTAPAKKATAKKAPAKSVAKKATAKKTAAKATGAKAGAKSTGAKAAGAKAAGSPAKKAPARKAGQ